MSENVTSLRVFARVARTESFSRAGRELGMPQSSVSRIIADLEREIATRLLTRTTRAVVLTEAGAEYLARIEPILAALDEANQFLRGTGELRGVLRIGAPASIALREIIPKLAPFMQEHPSLKIELQMKDEYQDLLKDGVDVAIRLGDMKDSTATSRVVGVNQRVLVAAPAYLERAGPPAIPADLTQHKILFGPPSTTPDAWTFERAGKTVSIQVRAALQTSLNEGATAAAVAGLGILSTGLWGCRAELHNGTLVRVLPEWNMGRAKAHAVFPAGRTTKLSAKSFVDFLAEALKR